MILDVFNVHKCDKWKLEIKTAKLETCESKCRIPDFQTNCNPESWFTIQAEISKLSAIPSSFTFVKVVPQNKTASWR